MAWEIVSKWEYLAKKTIGTQLVRSADSIGANLAEGTGRGSAAENCRFAKIARGSLFEVKHWLRRAFKRNLLTEVEIDSFQDVDQRTNSQIVGLHKFNWEKEWLVDSGTLLVAKRATRVAVSG